MDNDSTNTPDSASATAEGGFDVQTSWSGQAAVLAVRGAVDALTAPRLEQAIERAAAAAPAALIVDLSAVEFLASAGMNVLVKAQQELGTSVRLAVVADGPATSRPLKLIGIDTLVPLHQTLNDALVDVAPAAPQGE